MSGRYKSHALSQYNVHSFTFQTKRLVSELCFAFLQTRPRHEIFASEFILAFFRTRVGRRRCPISSGRLPETKKSRKSTRHGYIFRLRALPPVRAKRQLREGCEGGIHQTPYPQTPHLPRCPKLGHSGRTYIQILDFLCVLVVPLYQGKLSYPLRSGYK